MSFKQNLIRARSHFVFLIGLAVAFSLVIWLEQWQPAFSAQAHNPVPQKLQPVTLLAPTAVLTEQERAWAAIAWRYFENNYQPETGLVNSADAFPASTLWDTASYLLALISAERLALIDRATFDARVAKLLQSLAGLQLFDGKLPNKSYNTQTLQMVDYNNQPSARGIGWSAIDIGRILVPLNLLVWNYPQHTALVQQLLVRWSFPALIEQGEMFGATLTSTGETQLVQEGRLGYEQYAAKSIGLLGQDVSTAMNYGAHLSYVNIYGIPVPTDSRDPAKYIAHNYVVSEPYILDGLEYGGDQISREFAYRVYAVQEKRYQATGRLTAVSEDNIDEAPYFVYNTVYTGGKAWQTITDSGQDASKFRSLSTKAAFGWHALYGTPYTQQLVEAVASLHNPDKGWYSGVYEESGKPNKAITANTNAIVLESLCYRQFGPLMRQAQTTITEKAQ